MPLTVHHSNSIRVTTEGRNPYTLSVERESLAAYVLGTKKHLALDNDKMSALGSLLWKWLCGSCGSVAKHSVVCVRLSFPAQKGKRKAHQPPDQAVAGWWDVRHKSWGNISYLGPSRQHSLGKFRGHGFVGDVSLGAEVLNFCVCSHSLLLAVWDSSSQQFLLPCLHSWHHEF